MFQSCSSVSDCLWAFWLEPTGGLPPGCPAPTSPVGLSALPKEPRDSATVCYCDQLWWCVNWAYYSSQTATSAPLWLQGKHKTATIYLQLGINKVSVVLTEIFRALVFHSIGGVGDHIPGLPGDPIYIQGGRELSGKQ